MCNCFPEKSKYVLSGYNPTSNHILWKLMASGGGAKTCLPKCPMHHEQFQSWGLLYIIENITKGHFIIKSHGMFFRHCLVVEEELHHNPSRGFTVKHYLHVHSDDVTHGRVQYVLRSILYSRSCNTACERSIFQADRAIPIDTKKVFFKSVFLQLVWWHICMANCHKPYNDLFMGHTREPFYRQIWTFPST